MKCRLLWSIIMFCVISAFSLQPAYAQALTGSKVIGTGGDYTSLGAAIADINTKGVSGTLTLLVNDNLTETGSPEITTTTLAGANKLVIKPNTGKTPVVTFTACATSGNKGNSGLAVSGTVSNVGNITIDGSNTANGTTKDMTFALSDAAAGRYALRFNGETDDITIRNLKITAAAILPTTSSGTRTYGIYALSSTTAAADRFTVSNCEIGTAQAAFYYGLYKPDGGTVPYGSTLNISQNTIFAQHKGISVWGTEGTSQISGNAISIVGHPTGVYVQNSINGIYFESWKGTMNIFNNKVITLKAKAVTQTSLKPLYGILVYYASGSGITGQTVNIYNNFISDFAYSGDASTFSSEINGIALDALDQNVNVYFNTVYINNTAITTNPVYGIRVYDDANQAVTLKNNIIVNTVDHDSSYAIHCNPIVNNALKASDYNDLYVAGAKASLAYLNAVKHKTLANWKTASGKDANSQSENPANPFGGAGQLKSITDLHWVSKPAALFAGTPLTGFTADIDDDTRSLTKPYMGADEGAALTAIAAGEMNMPEEFSLNQNYPNPFNPSTIISFNLKTNEQTLLQVFDILGRNVATLVNGRLNAGSHSVSFSASDLSAGIYIYRLTAGSYTETKQMMLIK